MDKLVFLNELVSRIEADYTAALATFGEGRAEIEEKTAELSGNEALFTKYLYAHMPVSDACAVEFEIIESYAKHGAFLVENSEFLEGVTPEYFLQYVVAHRINSEDITECRRFFYDLVHERVKGMKRSEAVLEANNWCYEQATYRSTSIRTQSPMTMYKSGFGRCGEESTFLTTVLRSLGIPSRQVYVPRWSHSDSNHAWVEIWCEDGWHYTGACEPKPILNNGWFPYAASRAMVVHSRLFDSPESTNEEITERDGLAVLLNESARYSHQTPLCVSVIDKAGKAVKDAKVYFEIVNSAEFFPIASGKTDSDGKLSIHLGKGDVHITVCKNGEAKAVFADLRKESTVDVCLDGAAEEKESWLPYHINAPESAVVSSVDMTPEQEEYQNAKNAVGDGIRTGRIDSYFDKEYASEWESYSHITRTLNESKGNFAEIRKFLDKEYKGIDASKKDMLLGTISQKDCRDITLEVLEDSLAAFEYKKDLPDELFAHCVLSPRLFFETATPFRKYLREKYGFFKTMLEESPAKVWNWIEENIKCSDEREYTTIISVPAGTLKAGSSTLLSQKVLFVAICRTFGVPARMDFTYDEPMYYENGEFKFVRDEFTAAAKLIITTNDAKLPDYGQSFTIGRKRPDGNYETLGIWGARFENGKLEVELAKGSYRILTCERTSSGSILGKQLFVELNEGDEKHFEMTCSEQKREDFINEKAIPEVIETDCGKAGKLGLLFFAEPGKEPTEHVFNELLEISSMSGFPKKEINLVLKDEKALEDPTLKKILKVYPDIKLHFVQYDELVKKLEEATGVTSKNLPYICVTEGNTKSLYCCSGYNVGCVDVFAKLLA